MRVRPSGPPRAPLRFGVSAVLLVAVAHSAAPASAQIGRTEIVGIQVEAETVDARGTAAIRRGIIAAQASLVACNADHVRATYTAGADEGARFQIDDVDGGSAADDCVRSALEAVVVGAGAPPVAGRRFRIRIHFAPILAVEAEVTRVAGSDGGRCGPATVYTAVSIEIVSVIAGRWPGDDSVDVAWQLCSLTRREVVRQLVGHRYRLRLEVDRWEATVIDTPRVVEFERLD